MEIPASLESLTLIEATRSWSFSTCRKQKFPPLIVHVFPSYTLIPSPSDACYVTFYWSELLLYYPFRRLPEDIGLSDDDSKWEQIKHTYTP